MPEQMTEERLRKLEVQNAEILLLLRGLSEKVEGRMAASDSWRDKVERILVGDGNGQKGHNVRLDRLEQAQERQKWATRTVGAGVMLLVLKAVAGLLGAS
jgi:hypothetical protein